MQSTATAINRKQLQRNVNRYRLIAVAATVIALTGLAVTQAHAQISVDGKTTGQTINGYANRAAYTGNAIRRVRKLPQQATTKPAAPYNISYANLSTRAGRINPDAQLALYTVDNNDNVPPLLSAVNNNSYGQYSTIQQPDATFVADRYSRQHRRPSHRNSRRRNGYGSHRYNNSYYYGGYNNSYYGYNPYYYSNHSYRSNRRYDNDDYTRRSGYSYYYPNTTRYYSNQSYIGGNSYYSGYGSHYGSGGYGGHSYGGYGHGYGHGYSRHSGGYSGLSISLGGYCR